jgi:tetratricopeptide (TPR) repeat protein
MKKIDVIKIILTTIILTSYFAKVSEANNIKLLLHIRNSEGGQTFYKGQPITIQVALQDVRFFDKANNEEIKEKLNKGELKAETFGTKEWPWFRGIKIQVQKIEKLSDGTSKATQVLEKIDWLKKLASPAGAFVNNEPVYNSIVCVLTIEPEISQTLESGQYTFKAKWDSNEPNSPKDGIWQGRLETESVVITIASAQTNEEIGKLAFTKASYYLVKKNYDSALKEALIVEKVFPSYNLSQCYDIIARIYEEKGDVKWALEYYNKFLQANKDANEQRWDYIIIVKNKVRILEERTRSKN